MTTNWQSLQGTLKTIGLRTGAFWRWLTEPAETVQEPEHRRQARLLAGMLVTIILVGIWIVLDKLFSELAVSDLVTVFREHLVLPITFVVLVICGVTYGLSRSKHYTWGAFILIVNIFVAIFIQLIIMQDPYGLVGTSSFLVLCILLGSLFFPIWGAIILYMVCLVGIQMLPLFSVPAIAAAPLSHPAAFNVVLLVGAAIMMFAAMRQQDLRQIQQQAQELVETTLDAARRTQAAETLTEERNLLRTLIDNIPDHIFVKDTESQFIVNNAAHMHSLGATTQEELIGKMDADVIAHELAERYYAEEQEIIRSAQPLIDSEELVVDSDGREKWLLTTKVPLQDAKGKIVGLVGISRDVTERKKSEEALLESEERMRRLASATHEGIVFTEDGKVVEVNDQLAQMLGCELSELIGKSPMEFVAPESRSLVIEKIKSGVEEPYEHLAMRKGGTIFPVEIQARMLTIQGRQMRVSAIRDITERKQAEIERENLILEMEDKNAELERFTYTVSHDLKAPLITITGFLGYLEQDALSGDLERLRGDIQRISAASTKMQRLLDELLELSRIGRLMNSPVEVPFEEIANEALDNVHGQLEARGVTVELDPNLPTVYGDRQRLVEVLQNLIDNAAKCMGEQSDPRIEIGQRGKEDGKPVFCVKDNGIGIAPKYHEKIFGLFEKLDAKTDGTGIGLALVKRIVEFHGGRIWVESDAGQESTFYFTLLCSAE